MTPPKTTRDLWSTQSAGAVLSIYPILATITWIVFGQTVGHQFVAYDDQNYVYENSQITAGVTLQGLGNAFTHAHARNWHPLTTISHMLDCQFFGLDPAGHHLVNVFLHLVAVLLLFSVLREMTGALWRSAFVAAVFAVHPLRAESVAWISERKDVLSGVFFMLTLIAYLYYVRRPVLNRYVCLLIVFGLALLSKAMLVTLPIILLLLDYWPLNRFQDECSRPPLRRLILEKLPLLFLSAGSAVATLIVQKPTIAYADQVTLTARVANSAISYFIYARQLVWPTRLAVFYPYAGDNVSVLEVVLAVVCLVAMTVAIFFLRRRFPYLLAGWGWYLISLVPVIGLVQTGLQGHADRYTYLPQIGLCIALTWAVSDFLQAIIKRREMVIGLALISIVLLTWRGWLQTVSWKNTDTLWSRTLAVDPNNEMANYYIARSMQDSDRVDDAIKHYEKALASVQAGSGKHYGLSPAILHTRLGNAYAEKQLFDDALAQYRDAIASDANFADAHTNLAAILLQRGNIPEAIAECEKALAIPPEDAANHVRLGTLLRQAGRSQLAVLHYRRALEIDPKSVEARIGLTHCSERAW